jgi:copper chaperone CopZ
MHCKACELLIENKLNEIDGVKVKNISSKTGEVNIEIKDKNNLKKVEESIEELGYSTSGKKNIAKNTIFDYIIIFLLFITV